MRAFRVIRIVHTIGRYGLDEFIRGLGMPRSLGEVKVGREHFERIASQAMGTPWVPRNPRRIDGPAEVREILELAA